MFYTEFVIRCDLISSSSYYTSNSDERITLKFDSSFITKFGENDTLSLNFLVS